MGSIDPLTAMTYRVSRHQENVTIATILLSRAGLADTRRVDLNEAAQVAVLGLAERIDNAVPGWTTPGRREVSASRIADAVVDEMVKNMSPAWALRALAGLRPDLRHKPGALARLKPASRAALARELRPIALGLLLWLEREGRFVSTDDDEPTAKRQRLIQPGEIKRRN